MKLFKKPQYKNQKENIPSNKNIPPPSASNFTVNFLALTVGLAILVILQWWWPFSTFRNGVIVCTVITTIICTYDLFVAKVWQRDSAGLVGLKPRKASLQRVLVKLVGLAFSLAVPTLAYLIFPEYQGTFYQPWWEVLKIIGIPLLILSPIYFWWIDGLQRDPYDDYWHLGAVFCCLEKPNRNRIAHHWGGWIVKGFFLPSMFCYLVGVNANLETAIHSFTSMEVKHWLSVYTFFYNWLYLADIIVAVIGYTVSLRILDTHTRTVQPTTLGWLVTLICYAPFSLAINDKFLHYQIDHWGWGAWLHNHPYIQIIWGLMILSMITIHALSMLTLGLRFSNLTHRGIVTDGLFKYSKHPDYICKNISWWLIWVPFIPVNNPWMAVRSCILLAMVNFIYYMRAVTEEQHLNEDPTYRAYAAWIAEYGLFARLK
ncbi:DUF1295 domain-containing protein [Candidatus Nitrosacidococcus tergens]|uniref:Isoprenylcysteine carboxyl methyltransferase family protein n=1 Tax=Candidatus Nitrosacidococcus tergens TaxID=553981 RepID=A0A7G1Q930_9GAMM|nr:DUF1295 domain-containing protein [Candidatus Nitrosacidococcus tergens]CAB1275448.1 Isoprenylcysteine carboxyl methyltransferase family protein [Candidatus Nitrosacidococcus tergens]